MQRTFIRAAAAALLCAGALAACGGGGGPAGVPPTTLTTPTPTATPTPTPTPTSNSGTATVTSAATAAPIPAAGGYTGTLNLPSSNAGGSVALALTTTTVAPSGLAPMAIVRRPSALPTGSSVLLYETIASPVTITFSATPEIDLTLPSQVSTSGVQFFIAAYDPAQGWQEPAAGPATVKGQSVTFASMPVPFTLQANVTYTLALYSAPVASSRPTPTPVSTATPTPAPSATPTPAPTPTPTPTPGASKISLSPSPLSVEVLKIGSFTASEAGYSGSFTAKLTSGTCEVWAPNGSYGSGGSAIAPDGIFDVGPSDSNPCSISVSDSNGNGATLDVSPTVATLGVSSSTLSLTGTGTANAQTFSTAGGLGPFTADSYDSSIISVSVDPIDQTTFHVTPLKAGQTTITVHDSTGQTTTVSVGVTTLSGVIQ